LGTEGKGGERREREGGGDAEKYEDLKKIFFLTQSRFFCVVGHEKIKESDVALNRLRKVI